MERDQDDKPLRKASLRSTAEKRMGRKAPPLPPLAGEMEAQRLVHELQVHQIELELQNEELRHTRDEAEAAHRRYLELFDFAPIGYLTIDRNCSIRTANLAGAAMLGVPRSRLIGTSLIRFISDRDRSIASFFLSRVFQNQGSDTCEALMRTVDQRPFHAQIEATIDESKGECLVALIDISAVKEAEAGLQASKRQLEQANETLEQRVADGVAELSRLDQVLLVQSRLAAMGEMINNIAHQWRQPLNLVGLHVQRLAMLYGSEECSKESFDATVEDVMKLILHMSRTIDDFRNFFKPDKEQCAFNVQQAVQQAVNLVADSFRSNHITVITQGDGTATVSGYPNEFSQALLNVLQNARDALAERRVPKGMVTIASSVEDGKSVITIADNAGGIPEEIIDRIFEPYFSTKGVQGTGIGLYMTKSIIEHSMGGRISARNTGTGAEFRIEV